MNTYRLTDFITIWYTVKKHEMPAAGNNQKGFFLTSIESIKISIVGKFPMF